MLVSFLKGLFVNKPKNDKARVTPSADRGTTRKLHIGGTHVAAGWEVFNSAHLDFVDHVGDAVDLSRFPDATFSHLYASHILEHLDYKDALEAGLNEWIRVLKPGGVLMVAVPDLAALSRLLLSQELSLSERFHITRMIFGGHVDRFDYHLSGFDLPLLSYFLQRAGFVEIERVGSFGLFKDCSEIVFKSTPISLNLVARKPIH